MGDEHVDTLRQAGFRLLLHLRKDGADESSTAEAKPLPTNCNISLGEDAGII